MTTVHVVVSCVNEAILSPVECAAFVRKEEITSRTGNERLSRKCRLLVHSQASIESRELIIDINKSPIGTEKSNERVLLSNVTLQTQDSDHSVFVDKSGIGGQSILWTEVSRTVVGSDQQSKRVPINFAGQFYRNVRIDDRARVHRGDLRVKDVDTFKEERPFLREEDRKALVRRDYKLIRFDLCEVGIQSKVQGHVR